MSNAEDTVKRVAQLVGKVDDISRNELLSMIVLCLCRIEHQLSAFSFMQDGSVAVRETGAEQ